VGRRNEALALFQPAVADWFRELVQKGQALRVQVATART